MILLLVDKSLEIGFYYTILLFGWAINLWVKSCKKLPFNTKEVLEQRLKLKDKD